MDNVPRISRRRRRIFAVIGATTLITSGLVLSASPAQAHGHGHWSSGGSSSHPGGCGGSGTPGGTPGGTPSG